MNRPPIRGEQGFSLVEVLIALVLFSVGALALASTTGYVTTQVRAAGMQTERATVAQTAIEEIRAVPFQDLAPLSSTNAREIAGYDVWWDVEDVTPSLKEVRVHVRGPGLVREGGLRRDVTDVFPIRIARPLP